MSKPSGSANGQEGRSNGEDDLRSLLEALKADIGELKNESDLLRSQAVAKQETVIIADRLEAPGEGEELYSMLAELKKDIVSLRSDNDALARGETVVAPVRAPEKTNEVAIMLHELKSDINDLKHDNESLRLENLTARDGARLENVGGAYRNENNQTVAGLMKGAAALVLVAAAAGGGYYLAKSQGGGTTNSGVSPNIASTRPTGPTVKPSIVAQTTKNIEQPGKSCGTCQGSIWRKSCERRGDDQL